MERIICLDRFVKDDELIIRYNCNGPKHTAHGYYAGFERKQDLILLTLENAVEIPIDFHLTEKHWRYPEDAVSFFRDLHQVINHDPARGFKVEKEMQIKLPAVKDIHTTPYFYLIKV